MTLANKLLNQADTETMNADSALLFENLSELLTPDQVTAAVHVSRATIYDWKYRPGKYGIPNDMFLKGGRKLLIRKDVFRKWFFSRYE